MMSRGIGVPMDTWSWTRCRTRGSKASQDRAMLAPPILACSWRAWAFFQVSLADWMRAWLVICGSCFGVGLKMV